MILHEESNCQVHSVDRGIGQLLPPPAGLSGGLPLSTKAGGCWGLGPLFPTVAVNHCPSPSFSHRVPDTGEAKCGPPIRQGHASETTEVGRTSPTEN